jgi:hypothetical protein
MGASNENQTRLLKEALMPKLRFIILAGSALALATTTAGAQGRRTGIPPGQMPPAGLCRVWIDGVPAGRQPGPTDCRTARAHAPPNSHIIYGSQSQGRVGLDPRVGTISGRYDQRADPRSPRYDPRYDSNSRLYDPRYVTNGSNGRYDLRRDQNDNNGRYDSRDNDRSREKLDRKRQEEHEKAERKNEKRENSINKHDGDDRGRDHR